MIPESQIGMCILEGPSRIHIRFFDPVGVFRHGFKDRGLSDDLQGLGKPKGRRVVSFPVYIYTNSEKSRHPWGPDCVAQGWTQEAGVCV